MGAARHKRAALLPGVVVSALLVVRGHVAAGSGAPQNQSNQSVIAETEYIVYTDITTFGTANLLLADGRTFAYRRSLENCTAECTAQSRCVSINYVQGSGYCELWSFRGGMRPGGDVYQGSGDSLHLVKRAVCYDRRYSGVKPYDLPYDKSLDTSMAKWTAACDAVSASCDDYNITGQVVRLNCPATCGTCPIGWGERFNLSVYDSAYSSSEAAWLGAYFGHGDSWVDARTEVHECAELCPGSRYILHSEVGVNALKCKCMGITLKDSNPSFLSNTSVAWRVKHERSRGTQKKCAINGQLCACNGTVKYGYDGGAVIPAAGYMVMASGADTCNRQLSYAECKTAAATLTAGGSMDLRDGTAAKQYGPEWPAGCFMRTDNGRYFFNTGGTAGTPTQAAARRICRGKGVGPNITIRAHHAGVWAPTRVYMDAATGASEVSCDTFTFGEPKGVSFASKLDPQGEVAHCVCMQDLLPAPETPAPSFSPAPSPPPTQPTHRPTIGPTSTPTQRSSDLPPGPGPYGIRSKISVFEEILLCMIAAVVVSVVVLAQQRKRQKRGPFDHGNWDQTTLIPGRGRSPQPSIYDVPVDGEEGIVYDAGAMAAAAADAQVKMPWEATEGYDFTTTDEDINTPTPESTVGGSYSDEMGEERCGYVLGEDHLDFSSATSLADSLFEVDDPKLQFDDKDLEAYNWPEEQIDLGMYVRRTHSPQQCTWAGCNFAGSVSQLKRHMYKHTGERPHVCTWQGCQYATSQGGHLAQHMRTHTGEKPHKCNMPGCNYASLRRRGLNNHMLVTHGRQPVKVNIVRATPAKQPRKSVDKSRQVQCTWPGCDFMCSGGTKLTRHVQLHTGARPYVCNWEGCDYASTQRGHLVLHMRTHTGEKPYACRYDWCDFRATRRRGLNTHMLRTHGEVLEKHSRARTAPTAAAQTVASMTAFPVALGVPHPQEPPPTTHTSLALLSAEATVFGHSEFVKVEPEYDTTVKAEPLSADDGQCTDVDSASACTPESKT